MSFLITLGLVVVSWAIAVKILALTHAAQRDWVTGAGTRAAIIGLQLTREGAAIRYHELTKNSRFFFLDGIPYSFWKVHVRGQSKKGLRVRIEGLARFLLSIFVLTPIAVALLILQGLDPLQRTDYLSPFTFWVGFTCVVAVLTLQLCSAVTQSIRQLIWGDFYTDLVGYRSDDKEAVVRLLNRAAAFVGSLVFYYLASAGAVTWGAMHARAFAEIRSQGLSLVDALYVVLEAFYRVPLLVLGAQQLTALNSFGAVIIYIVVLTAAAYIIAALALVFGFVLQSSAELPKIYYSDRSALVENPIKDEMQAPFVEAQPSAPEDAKGVYVDAAPADLWSMKEGRIAVIGGLVAGFVGGVLSERHKARKR